MRPVKEDFNGLFGNTATKERIASAIRSGTLPHAFLIDGPHGSGKSTLAYEIAAALSCERKGNDGMPLPCRRCNTCRRIFEGSFTDIKVLDKPKDKATLGVEQVKIFKEDMFLSAGESEYKIYLIKSAHLLTAQAQNALLTVMEEPPPRVIIFLLSSSSDKILTTIKSRAQYIAMQRFSKPEIAEYLTASDASARALMMSDKSLFDTVLIRADGCIGRAKELLTSSTAKDAEKERLAILRVVRAFDTRAPYSELYSALSALPEKRHELVEALEDTVSAITDMIKSKCSDREISTAFFDSADSAREATKGLSLKRLFAISELIVRTEEHITKNAMISAAVPSLAAKIKLI